MLSRRQRLGTTPVHVHHDHFGAKHLLLSSVREHHLRVVQRSAFVSTDKLWLSRIRFSKQAMGRCTSPGVVGVSFFWIQDWTNICVPNTSTAVCFVDECPRSLSESYDEKNDDRKTSFFGKKSAKPTGEMKA